MAYLHFKRDKIKGNMGLCVSYIIVAPTVLAIVRKCGKGFSDQHLQFLS